MIHDPSHHTGYLTWQLGQATAQRLEKALRPIGISLAQVRAVVLASLDPGISSAELARRSGLTAQSMGAAVQGLVDRGALERSPHPENRRVQRLHVTDEGLALAERAQSALERVQDEMFGVLPERERAALHRALHRVVEHNIPEALRTVVPPEGD
ncbi:MarR family winged helix-turn-helix transcriptional regulator [Streptomyces sp. NBC_01497]|uniref:MarR family winged helix-turn-helix transcriptional regulator n=1 Tax=Streptomyces sp. NBC_01497 TaxID=2903885 RepID=UPI002E36A14E|nr:MarR family transcriptional regulator [Streptomyces sp. NBC_01497]